MKNRIEKYREKSVEALVVYEIQVVEKTKLFANYEMVWDDQLNKTIFFINFKDFNGILAWNLRKELPLDGQNNRFFFFAFFKKSI